MNGSSQSDGNMTSATTSPLHIDRTATIWTFTLAAPERRNALSAALVDALLAGVADAHAAGAQVLVFQGEGRNFSAGFDFTDVEAQSEGDLLLRFVRIEQLLQAVATSPCVTLAHAHGKNFGAGVDLIAACRQRVAAPDASFQMPGLQFGLVLGTRRFGEIVGAPAARRILENSETFGALDGADGSAKGFVTQIVSSPQDVQAAIAAAEALAARLDATRRTALYSALSSSAAHGNDDLAALVISAARPGIKARIARYLDPHP